MEIQLQELIDQIKKDGVAAAESEAEAILAAAKAEALDIVANAKEEADRILSDAKAQRDRTVKMGEDSLRQAGRNLLLSFRESVTKEMNAVVGNQVRSAYSKELLSELIVKVIEAWSKNADTEDITVLLNPDDLAALEENLLAATKEKMLTGVTFKASESFDIGFRVVMNEGSVYYDYSSEAVVELLSTYLSPKVTALLKEAE